MFPGILALLGTSGLFAQPVELKGHTRDVHAVACSADGKLLASGGEDGSAIVWDAVAGKQLGSYKGDAVLSVAISPDGKRVAAGERYNKIRLLDASGKEVKTLEGHQGGVIAVGFTPDSKVLLSFAKDGGIRMWDAATGAAQGAPLRVPDSFDAAAFSADGKWVVGGAGSVYLYSLAGKKLAWKAAVDSPVRGVAVSGDGKLAAVALGDDSVRLLDGATGKERGKTAGADTNGLAFTGDGTRIAAAGHDNEVRVIEAASMKVLATLKGHDRTVRSVCFLPDGKTVASASFDMTVRMWR